MEERLKSLHPKNALKEVKAKVDGIFLEESSSTYNGAADLFIMNNRFDKSEANVQYRLDSIAKNGAGFFERNLEVLTFKHCYAYTSSKELNKVFPIIKSAMAFLTHMGNAVNKNFK